ncbi:MAG TPA: D-2-hydroxyacid dehydrogenase [Steroidobacteraceae bacterium]|nr:D-2-hydroxyacid dehydrogenase [Steroidobacteraceae bacterium]
MIAKVVYIGTQEADAHAFMELAARDFPALDLYATNDRTDAITHVADAEGIIAHHFQFDEALLQSATKLRWIQSLTTGTDGILRLQSLRADVIVTSTRGMHGPQMSELVFLQMLALSRRFSVIQRNQRQKHWVRWPQPLLLNKTIVIVGVGKIAEALASRCVCFGMTVYGVSQSARVPPGFKGVYGRAQLATAAAMADFLVLLVPYMAETESLVDARIIDAMKPSAFLINVARGGVLDESALLHALRVRRIAGAALDVFRETPLPPEDPLWAEEQLIITPTLGGMSDIYLDQAYPIVRDNLKHFLTGETRSMHNVVDRKSIALISIEKISPASSPRG